MLFQVYGENALFQWGGLIAVLLVLMLLNWYSIKSKRGAIIMLIAVPAVVTAYCIAVAVGAASGAEWALQSPTNLYMNGWLGQFTRNYTQTVKRAADNKRRYAPGEGSIPPVLLSGVSKGVPPLAHDFACKV